MPAWTAVFKEAVPAVSSRDGATSIHNHLTDTITHNMIPNRIKYSTIQLIDLSLIMKKEAHHEREPNGERREGTSRRYGKHSVCECTRNAAGFSKMAPTNNQQLIVICDYNNEC